MAAVSLTAISDATLRDTTNGFVYIPGDYQKNSGFTSTPNSTTGPESFYVESEVRIGIGTNASPNQNYAVLYQFGGVNVYGSVIFTIPFTSTPTGYKMTDGYFGFYTENDGIVPTVAADGTNVTVTVNFGTGGGGHTVALVLVTTTAPTAKSLSITGSTFSETVYVWGA